MLANHNDTIFSPPISNRFLSLENILLKPIMSFPFNQSLFTANKSIIVM
uniref:Uncharacterized protein n=1 Tax=Anguilla anguilla TaxID=7936 RepID=A0A0E9QTS5_ANGAN